MENKSYFLSEIMDKGTDKERIVIKFNSSLSNTIRIHKATAFLEKYPKTTGKNLRIADDLVNFLNFVQAYVNRGEIRGLDYMTFEHGREYINSLSDDIPHARKNAINRLLTRFYYFLAKGDGLRKIKKCDFEFDLKAGKDVLKIPF